MTDADVVIWLEIGLEESVAAGTQRKEMDSRSLADEQDFKTHVYLRRN